MATKFTKDMEGRPRTRKGGRTLAQTLLDRAMERDAALSRADALGIEERDTSPISRMGEGLAAIRKKLKK